MKKLLGFVILCIPLYVCGSDNLIFNPSFDMTPWDTGWTWDTLRTRGATDGSASSSVSVKEIDSDISPPNRCHLRTSSRASGGSGDASGGNTSGEANVYQIFKEIKNPTTCKVHVRYWMLCYGYRPRGGNYGICNIQLCINGEWQRIWETTVSSSDTSASGTTLVDNFVDGTVSGIKFYCSSGASAGYLSEGYSCVSFSVDDVYVGETGIEEDSRLQIADSKVEISPNPFIHSTTIKYHLPTKSKVSLEIYDITGRTVKTLVNEEKEAGSYNISFDARGLSAGIYFVKLVVDGVKKTKKLTILR
ncbi:T9SS type A sorting domain-containing protein [candidate division WOR-3 bacterium]|nr:T9SS type A sorting domain-containing protein [candidate division WOR-3 bacterium]